MEEASEAPARPRRRSSPRTLPPRPRAFPPALALIALLTGCSPARSGDASARLHTSNRLVYGSDAEGGGPYAYPDPDRPSERIGFEVELMDKLARGLGVTAEFRQGQWDSLLPTLRSGHIDAVVNGYELTPARLEQYLATRPYYIYELQLMAPKGGRVASFDDLTRPKPGGGRWKVAVLGGSAAETYTREHGGDRVEVLYFNGATDCMMAVKNGQADATLQDLPAARFYRGSYPTLDLAGPPVGRGYYVMYLRKGDEALRDALDRGIEGLIRSGEVRAIYEKYSIWTEAQAGLAALDPADLARAAGAAQGRGLPLLRRYGPTLLAAAGMTIVLSVTSMPLAMALGLAVALARLYGPAPLRRLAAVYVELLRGTPLMLQLYVLFFLLPEVGIELPALLAGVLGLAINYSAYEAEIYRAGLQAIPQGQMEAALALGMTRGMALRRVIVPQAVRIVIPPVTNDFIALFKDTSVCSVISLVELTKQYSILANSTGGVVEFALASAALYLAMSLPLSWFSRWFERKLGAEGPKGGAIG